MPHVPLTLSGTFPTPPYNFGTVLVGTPTPLNIAIDTFGNFGTIQITGISVGGVPYVLSGLPTLPLTMGVGDGASFTLTFTPAAPGTFNDTLTINWKDFNGNPQVFTGAITGVGAATGLNTSPSPIAFPDTVITHTSGRSVTVKNIGAGNVTINSIAMVSGANFALTGLPGLPLTLLPGNTTIFNMNFTPGAAGPFTDTLHIVTAASGNFDTPATGNGVPIVPVSISKGIYALLFGFSNPLSTETLTPTNLNGGQAGTLIFNGTLWDVPGFEKKLRRIRFWYENVGVAVLTATVSSPRPSVGVNFVDSKSAVATLGTVAADGSEQTGFFDVQIAGELITFQITRAGGGGPVSLLGFLPEFEDGGEKVEGT